MNLNVFPHLTLHFGDRSGDILNLFRWANKFSLSIYFLSFSGLRNPSNFWTGEISYASGDIKRGQQKHKFYGHEASGAVNLCMNLWWLLANVRLNGLELKLEMMKFVIHIDCGLLYVGGLLMD